MGELDRKKKFLFQAFFYRLPCVVTAMQKKKRDPFIVHGNHYYGTRKKKLLAILD